MFITIFFFGLKTSQFLRFFHCYTKITTVQQRVAARFCEGLLLMTENWLKQLTFRG